MLDSNCLNCKKKIRYCPHTSRGKYCSNKCQANFKYSITISDWKAGKLSGWTGKTKQLAPWLRRYLFETRGPKCENCGWDEVHPVDKLPLVEIDHIDGNAENNTESNLKILCPNCHSMTPTFRARNKNSSRVRNKN